MANQERKTTVVILGASGDLTRRKLGPALFNLLGSGSLPELCSFVGMARSDFSDAEYREFLREGVARWFCQNSVLQSKLDRSKYTFAPCI